MYTPYLGIVDQTYLARNVSSCQRGRWSKETLGYRFGSVLPFMERPPRPHIPLVGIDGILKSRTEAA